MKNKINNLVDNCNQIIDSLHVSFDENTSIFSVNSPFIINDYYEMSNTLFYVRKGNMYYGRKEYEIKENSLFFIPDAYKIHVAFHSNQPNTPTYYYHDNEYLKKRTQHINFQNNLENDYDIIALLFTSKIFNAVSLFTSLNIPAFILPDPSGKIKETLISIIKEISNKEQLVIGKNKIIETQIEQLVIFIIRSILDNNLFVQQLTVNSNNLRDDRLIVLFKYINDNLEKDLSNSKLASVVKVSEDYVGQYFKMLTNMNPQDYIEAQRMEGALHLLKNTNKSISQIGRETGYKDSSYFCRRFKVMFGISAGRMRSRNLTREIMV